MGQVNQRRPRSGGWEAPVLVWMWLPPEPIRTAPCRPISTDPARPAKDRSSNRVCSGTEVLEAKIRGRSGVIREKNRWVSIGKRLVKGTLSRIGWAVLERKTLRTTRKVLCRAVKPLSIHAVRGIATR
jgi:hypothetical protein